LHAAGAADGDGRLLCLLGLVEERVVASGHGLAAGRQLPASRAVRSCCITTLAALALGAAGLGGGQ
jgi:hypothetical protein